MLKATYKHTGKMEGMTSLSTFKGVNPFCIAHAKVKGSICEKCFVEKFAKLYGENFVNKFTENFNILTSRDITEEEIKKLGFINCRVVRFEAYGDLYNVQQMKNYINICNYYKETTFAIWTKNPQIIAETLKEVKKPKNLIIILSSLFVNVEAKNKYDFVDKVFTVYDKDYIAENDIKINCGAKNCMSCLNCYKKNKVTVINEILK